MILKNTSEVEIFRGVFDTFMNNVYFDTIESKIFTRQPFEFSNFPFVFPNGIFYA